MTQPDTVIAYLEQFSGDVRSRLDTMRRIIQDEAPDAIESFSYGIIGYKLHGKPLVYVGGFTHHIGFYATPNGHDAFAKEFARYKQGRGSVQFPHSEPLPLELIRRVIKYRAETIRATQ